MEKREILNRMIEEGLIPVIRVASAKEAIDVADAIKEGGVSFIEITMSVPGAIDTMDRSCQKRAVIRSFISHKWIFIPKEKLLNIRDSLKQK